MLHILLMILKIIGILILVILGLLLTVILLVLLVPVQYRLRGSYREKPAGEVRVTWLLRMLSAQITYDEDLDAQVKVLGFRIFRLKDKAAGDEPDEMEPDEMEPESEIGWVENGQTGTEDKVSVPDKSREAAAETSPEPSADRPLDEDKIQTAETASEPSAESLKEDESPEPDKAAAEDEEPADDQKVPEDLFEKIEYLFSGVCDKLEAADKTKKRLMKLWEHPDTQHTISLLWRQVKKIIRHVIPQKAGGNVILGFDDPALTGQVMAVCSVLYALYGEQLVITPDFENKIIDGELEMKGRIRAGTLALIAVRVLADRKFWATLKRIKKFRANGGI